MRAFPFLVASFVSGSLLAVLVPQRSDPPRWPGAQATTESPAERIGSASLAGGAKLPAGTGSARDGFFNQLSTMQQADAIRRLNARLQGPPTPSDLRVVFQILAPLDWTASAALWRELREGKNARPLHPELLLVVAEHLAKKDPKATLALADESKNGPKPGRAGLSLLLRAAFGALLHRDAAEAAHAMATLPQGLLEEYRFDEGENNRRLDFTKIGGTFASVLQVVEENPEVLLKHEFTPHVLASLAYGETHSLPAAIEKLRSAARHLARTFPAQLKKAEEDTARNFEERFIREGTEHLILNNPVPLDASEVPERDKGPAEMLLALKAFRIGLSEDVDTVVAFLEKQSGEGSDASLKIGAFAGAMIRDAPAMLRALENTSSPTLKQDFFEIAPLAHATLAHGGGDGSISTADIVTVASDLQLSAPLAAEFFAYQLERKAPFFDFSGPQKSALPNGMLIESLPLPEPQKRELHRRFHAISLEK